MSSVTVGSVELQPGAIVRVGEQMALPSGIEHTRPKPCVVVGKPKGGHLVVVPLHANAVDGDGSLRVASHPGLAADRNWGASPERVRGIPASSIDGVGSKIDARELEAIMAELRDRLGL